MRSSLKTSQEGVLLNTIFDLPTPSFWDCASCWQVAWDTDSTHCWFSPRRAWKGLGQKKQVLGHVNGQRVRIEEGCRWTSSYFWVSHWHVEHESSSRVQVQWQYLPVSHHTLLEQESRSRVLPDWSKFHEWLYVWHSRPIVKHDCLRKKVQLPCEVYACWS